MANDLRGDFEKSGNLYNDKHVEVEKVTDKSNSKEIGKSGLHEENINEIPPSAERSKFPMYPSHGVIGTSEPAWMDAFYSSRNFKTETKHDFKKLKFDFYETYEKHLESQKMTPTPLPGLDNLWKNFNARQNASAEYQNDEVSLPRRFRNPALFKGYGCEKDEHPLFRTTSSSYGQFPPTTHDVPHKYHGLDTTFTVHLARTGMPRNRSLNIK